MGMLSEISDAVESYNRSVESEVKRVRADPKAAKETLARYNEIRASIPKSKTPTGIELPRLALPDYDEAGQVARYLMGEGLPGEFPFVNSAYRELYLEPLAVSNSNNGNSDVAGRNVKPKRQSKNGRN